MKTNVVTARLERNKSEWASAENAIARHNVSAYAYVSAREKWSSQYMAPGDQITMERRCVSFAQSV